MNKTINDLVFELRKLYPTLEIIVTEKEDLGRLYVNDKVVLKFEYEYMQKQLNRLKEDGFNQILHLWAEYVDIRYVQRAKRFGKRKSGSPGINLTASQIIYARSNTRSNSEAARFLSVDFKTYKRYARFHGLWEKYKNPKGFGTPKGGVKNKVPLEEIFANKRPGYALRSLKDRLISELILEEKCYICGYHERRHIDNKVSIVLDFIDGNNKNMSRENIRFICYNCAFNIRGKINKKSTKRLTVIKNSIESELINEKQEEIFEKLNKQENTASTDNTPIIQINRDDLDEIWDNFNK